MRKKFINTLVEIAEKDDRVYLLTADLGFGLVEPFAEKFPQRFINIGVSEQNMIGVASGLALSGKIVFVYSIANFPTLRCLEQIMNLVCYHNLRVHIVAGGTGLAYGALGVSHHACEDMAVMRALPNMNVICPNLSEVELATKAIYESKSPCYLRLGWATEKPYSNYHDFKIGEATLLISGSDACLISCGSMIPIALEVAKRLNNEKIGVSVISMHTIKPIDPRAIVNASWTARIIYTLEEHSIVGGLGSAVAEVIASHNMNIKFKRLGLPDAYCTKVSDRDSLLKEFRLDVDGVVNEVKDAIF